MGKGNRLFGFLIEYKKRSGEVSLDVFLEFTYILHSFGFTFPSMGIISSFIPFLSFF